VSRVFPWSRFSRPSPPNELFSEYVYFSSYSTTMVDHATSDSLSSLSSGNTSDQRGLVVGNRPGNDGYLLQWYSAAGIPVLGIRAGTPMSPAVAKEERDRNGGVRSSEARLLMRIVGEHGKGGRLTREQRSRTRRPT